MPPPLALQHAEGMTVQDLLLDTRTIFEPEAETATVHHRGHRHIARRHHPEYGDRGGTECPAKSTKNNENVLSGLCPLQLFPALFQGGGNLPPSPEVLLEGTLRGAVLAHCVQVFLFDVGQLRTAVLGAG